MEGAFVLLDRASRPLEQMEQRANRLERALNRATIAAIAYDAATAKAGKSTNVVGGEMTKTEQRANTLGRAYRSLENDTGRLTRAKRDLSKAFDSLGKSITSPFGKLMGFGKILGIGAGAGGLVQGVGALAGGIVGLLPQLGSLAGLVAPLPTMFTGLGLSMLTVKLGFSDLSKAMMGNQQALKRLTPEARQFLSILKGYSPEFKKMKESAQQGLFPGLTRGLLEAQAAFPTIDRILKMMGGAVGGGAANVVGQLTSTGNLRNFFLVAQQGARFISVLADSVGHFVQGILTFAVAARPFTNWMIDLMSRFAQWFEVTMRAKSASGQLQETLRRWQTELGQLGRILLNLGQAFQGLMRAALPLSRELWMGAERTTRSWARMTNSIQGQNSLQSYFLRLRPVIAEVDKILGHTVLGLMSMGTQPGFLNILKQLEPLGRSLVTILNSLANVYGPPLARFIASLGKLLTQMTGSNGPLLMFLNAMTRVLDLVTKLVSVVPGLGSVLTAAFGVFAIIRFTGAVATLTKSVFGLGKAWAFVTAMEARATTGGIAAGVLGGAGSAATAAEAAAAGAGVSSVVGAEAGALAGIGARIPGGATRMTTTASGLLIPAESSAAAALATGGTTAAVAGLGTRGLIGAVGGAVLAKIGPRLAMLGRIALPLMALSGVIGALTTNRQGSVADQISQTIAGGLNSATLGLFPKMDTPSEANAKDVHNWLTGMGNVRMGDRNRTIIGGLIHDTTGLTEPGQAYGHTTGGYGGYLAGSFAGLGGLPQGVAQMLGMTGGPGPRTPRQLAGSISALQGNIANLSYYLNPNPKARAHGVSPIAAPGSEGARQILAVVGALKQELDVRRRILETVRQQQRTADMQKAVTRDQHTATAFRMIYNKQGVDQAMKFLSPVLTQQMAGLGPQAQQHMAQQWLPFLEAIKKNFPKEIPAANTLEKNLKGKFGDVAKHADTMNVNILRGMKEKWPGIQKAMEDPINLAQAHLGNMFTAIDQQAIGALMAMGLSQSQAQQAIRAALTGGGAALGTSVVGASTANVATAVSAGARGAFGGKKKAGGGRLGGSSMRDEQMFYGGAGELVVNRHSELMADRLLSMQGTSLSRIVSGTNRKHYEDILPGFAAGGRIPNLIDAADMNGATGSGTVGGASFTLGAVARAGAEANRIAALKLPYVFGGGHSTPAPANGPFDCSSSVSRVLQASGWNIPTMVSSNFLNWGTPGVGPLTVVAKPGAGPAGHVYMIINGRGWGTSRSNPGGGPGWLSYGVRPGFSARIPPGVPGGPGGMFGNVGLHAAKSGFHGIPGALLDTAAAGYAGGLQGTLNSMLSGGDIMPGLSRGGRVGFGGWHARGVSMTVRHPTLIGVGDAGGRPEHVRVTPGGTGTGGGAPLIGQLTIAKIENHVPGDIRDIVVAEIEQALDEVAHEIETGSVVHRESPLK